MRPLPFFIALYTLTTIASSGNAAESKRVWELAQPARIVPGAPKYSDVSARSLMLRPANTKDTNDTFRMAEEFHLTRLDWCYGVDRAYAQRAKELKLSIGSALSSNLPDAKGKRDTGRVTDKEGKLRTYSWMADGVWAGCPTAPEFRAAWLYHATNAVLAGVDFIQQDDPHMSTRTTSLCYCKYCTAAFTKYQAQYGTTTNYAKFQQDVVLTFHREMHQQLDKMAGRHIPFSHNSIIGFTGKLDWTAPAFDFVNAEIEGKHVHPVELAKIAAVRRSSGVPMVFQYRETSVAANRRALAAIYANGMTMMLPWDVYMPDNAPRYFIAKEDIADLSGFIRANANYLDGYEHALAAGPGLTANNNALKIEGGSTNAFAFVRAQPGKANAPVVIHLVEWADSGKRFKLLLHKSTLGNDRKITAHLRVPRPYDAARHNTAQGSGNFSILIQETNLTVTTAGDWLAMEIPALMPWGLIVLQPE
ncbi:MAG: hypothetical protein ACO1QS_12405 [Verrucomicrobiota bacterium]